MIPAMPPAVTSPAPASTDATERAALKAEQRKERKTERRFARRDAKAIAAYADKQTSKVAPKGKSARERTPAPLVAGFSVERALIAKQTSVAYGRIDETGNYGYATKTLPPPVDVYDPDGRNFTGRRVFDDALVADCVKTAPDDFKQAIANAQRYIQAEAAQREP